VTPYYDDGQAVIYCGDAREVLVDAEVVADALITDPPYSSGGFQETGKAGGSIGTRTDEIIRFDNLSTRGYERLMREVLRHCNQVDEAFVFTDWRMWTVTFDALEAAGWRVRNMLVWDKRRMGMGMPWRNQHELIAYGKQLPGSIVSGKHGNVLSINRSGNANHPTEKPAELIQTILSNSEADRIVDPFMGSGTTLVAAKNLGRRAIGIEIEERYCEIAARRLSQGVLPLEAA
jgi:DNA modification methylase